MISTQAAGAELALEQSFISECRFDNKIITLGADAILTNNAEVAVSNLYFNEDKTKKMGRVRVIVSGDLSVEKHPDIRCDYKMVVEGEFSAAQDKPDEEVQNLLWFNGTSILYGIARAKMEVMSSTVFERGKITLPIVNMAEFIKQQNAAYLKKNDVQTES